MKLIGVDAGLRLNDEEVVERKRLGVVQDEAWPLAVEVGEEDRTVATALRCVPWLPLRREIALVRLQSLPAPAQVAPERRVCALLSRVGTRKHPAGLIVRHSVERRLVEHLAVERTRRGRARVDVVE